MAKKKKSRFAPLAMIASLGSGINLLKNSGMKLCLLLGGLLFIWLAVSIKHDVSCLLYTSPSPRDQRGSRMPSSA